MQWWFRIVDNFYDEQMVLPHDWAGSALLTNTFPLILPLYRIKTVQKIFKPNVQVQIGRRKVDLILFFVWVDILPR